jgi:ring-1,2-phenylacetyl-CoA epoxidase subunit PaaD
VLRGVADPEIPVLSVCDLGIVREITQAPDGGIDVVLTPTYSGCPATEWIERSVVEALEAAGLGPVRVQTRLAPAWSTDWISAYGLRKLQEFGIAPPHHPLGKGTAQVQIVRFAERALVCPRCGSNDTEQLSRFGSTACKSLWRCKTCGEPFEHFKPI